MFSKTKKSYAEVVAGVESSELECPDCGLVFESLSPLTRHYLDAHVDQRPLTSDDVAGSSRDVDIVDQESVDSDIVLVSSTSETESTTNSNAKRVYSSADSLKNRTFGPKSKKQRRMLKRSKSKKTVMKTNKKLTVHEISNVLTSDSASSDPANSATSSSEDDVLMHSAFGSSDEKKVIKCDMCHTHFSRVGNLNKHLRLKRCKSQNQRQRAIKPITKSRLHKRKKPSLIKVDSSEEDAPTKQESTELEHSVRIIDNLTESMKNLESPTKHQHSNDQMKKLTEIGDSLPERLEKWYGYHDGQKQLPIFEKGKLSYTKQEIAKILLEHDLLKQCGKVCARQPSNISASMSFVVDLDMLEDIRDLTSDDMGSYRQHGSPPEYVYVKFEDNHVKHLVCNRAHPLTTDELERMGLGDADVFILERKYGTCKASPDVRRMTAQLKVPDTKRSGHFINHKYCMVQYTFDEDDHEVSIPPHGNAKTSSRPYTKTKASVKKKLEITLEQTNLTPARAQNKVDSANGGYMLATSSSDLCRNRKQAWNINQKVKNNKSTFAPHQFGKRDELADIMKRCKSERKGEEFVREVVGAPEPRCVLANKRQINDIISFCCVDRPNNCVLGVDPTFNLGEFYVTFTVYRHLALEDQNGKHPLFLGPTLVHHRKLYSSYKHLPQVLGNIDPATKLIKAFGTDDEVNLYTALKDEWVEADHLSCFIHMKKNIERKLRDLGIKGGEVSKFLAEIFDENGILDAESPLEFDARLQSLEVVWKNREQAESKTNNPSFYDWILTEKAPIMKDTMLLDVRLRNGIRDKFTTNDNECMNSKFKKHVNYKASDLPKFIKDAEEFVKADQTVIEAAFAGTGEYRFVEGYETFNVGSKWWSFTPVKRVAHFNRFLEACKYGLRSTQVSSAMPQSTQSLVESSDIEGSPNSSIVARTENSFLMPAVNIAADVLEGIINKAEKLVHENLVSEIKGKGHTQVAIASHSDVYPRIVVREDRKRRGQNVVELKCGPGKGCLNFSTHGMCSHTQAAAVAWNVKLEYWKFLETSKKIGTSLQNLSRHGLPNGSGKKDNQIKRGNNKRKEQISQISSLPTNSTAIPSTRHAMLPPCINQQSNTSTAPYSPSSSSITNTRNTLPLRENTLPLQSVNLHGNTTSIPRSPVPPQTRGEAAITTRTFANVELRHSLNFPASGVIRNVPALMPEFPRPQSGHFWLYLLQFCPAQVSVCFGCSQSLKINGKICQPPHDLVIVSNMIRVYSYNGEQMSRRSNVYFHFNMDCVKKKQPAFHYGYLFFPPDVVRQLQEVHHQFLALQGLRL